LRRGDPAKQHASDNRGGPQAQPRTSRERHAVNFTALFRARMPTPHDSNTAGYSAAQASGRGGDRLEASAPRPQQPFLPASSVTTPGDEATGSRPRSRMDWRWAAWRVPQAKGERADSPPGLAGGQDDAPGSLAPADRASPGAVLPFARWIGPHLRGARRLSHRAATASMRSCSRRVDAR